MNVRITTIAGGRATSVLVDEGLSDLQHDIVSSETIGMSMNTNSDHSEFLQVFEMLCRSGS